jgi:hypothetical protein
MRGALISNKLLSIHSAIRLWITPNVEESKLPKWHLMEASHGKNKCEIKFVNNEVRIGIE